MSELNRLTEAIIGAAIEVHQRPGPGLLESAYRKWSVRDRNAETLRTQRIHPCTFTAIQNPSYRIRLRTHAGSLHKD